MQIGRLCLLVLCVVLQGCGGGKARNAGQIVLKFSTWGSPEEMTINRRIIDAFMSENPDIYVDIMHIPSSQYNTKLQILQAARVAPDVMWLNAWNAYTLYRNNRLLPLNGFIEEERKTNPEFLREPDSLVTHIESSYCYKGEYFLSPLGPVTYHLYYNKNLFDEENLAYPDETWDWDMLAAAAARLSRFRGDTPIQFGIHFHNWWGAWINFVWQNDGLLFDRMVDPTQCLIETAEAREALQFLHDLIYVQRAAPSPTQMSLLGGDFMTGKVAMQLQGSWMTEQYRYIEDFEWDMAPLPRRKQQAVGVRVCGHGIRRDTKYPEAAWRLVRFYQTERAQRLMGDFALWIPTREAWALDPEFWHPAGVPPDHARKRVEDIKRGRPGDLLDVAATRICETIIPMELDPFWLNKETLEECVARITPQVNAILAERTGN
ncbi:MAG TPA: sugar ABC transporter substrate-binding protein [Candidatus Sumerlaeota bacterium]|nr:MAG: Bacterial extracellular solute-binding protein [candidate division BRC1 bacterium ADurb.BinA292]HPK03726.1 sugar ABC transporter substrate-binding protein [Candidatus Sumerlaeota bacterium]